MTMAMNSRLSELETLGHNGGNNGFNENLIALGSQLNAEPKELDINFTSVKEELLAQLKEDSILIIF